MDSTGAFFFAYIFWYFAIHDDGGGKWINMNDTGSERAGREKNAALIFIIFCLRRVILVESYFSPASNVPPHLPYNVISYLSSL